jgi:pimeloyl-ACP methyl ester carboxylesterase
MGYAEAGPAGGRAVILLHGWPYGIHSYADVAPVLAAEGHRVIVPYLRGHGTTRFVHTRTFRSGQPTAVALDIIALMDALGIGSAVVGGFGWGAQTAETIAALWPERSRAVVSASGHPVAGSAVDPVPIQSRADWAWWPQHYLSPAHGWSGAKKNRHAFVRSIWKDLSPGWDFDDDAFERAAQAFDNPDWVGIAAHSYQWGLRLTAGDPQLDQAEARLAANPTISAPTITLDAERDPFSPANPIATHNRFTGKHEHRILSNVGHNTPEESPLAFAEAVIDAQHL